MNDGDYHPIGSAFDVGRSISNGFAAVRVAAGPLWLGGLLMWISDSCGGSGGLPDLSGLSGDDDSSASLLPRSGWLPSRFGASFPSLGDGDLIAWVIGAAVAFVLFALVVGLALFALHCFLQPGFIRLHVNVLQHAGDATAPLFSGRDLFWASLGWNALDRLALTAVFFIGVWPGALLAFIGWRTDSQTLQLAGGGLSLLIALPALIYVGLGTFLGAHAVVIERKSPVQALRRSWALARGNRFPLLLFAAVCLLLEIASAVGILLCCVGLLLTVPFAVAITGFARTEGFLLMTRGMQAGRDFKLWHLHEGEAQGGAAPAEQGPAPADASSPPETPRGVPRGWDTHLQPPKPREPDDEEER